MRLLREVEGFPGYRVGDDGSAVKLDGLELKPINVRMKSDGGRKKAYKRACVTFRRDGKRYDLRIATLVLTAFVSPRPLGMEACRGRCR